MKRMEIPRLALHNLQAKPCVVTPEASKHNKSGQSQHHAEPSPPPSRVLRNGKRVPTGTATKTVPQTQGQASRGPDPSGSANVQAAYHSVENAQTVKSSSSKADNPRTAGSPLSQLPLNKQIFNSPQLTKASEPLQQSTPSSQAPTATASASLSKPSPSLLDAPSGLSHSLCPQPVASKSPTDTAPAVTSNAFSSSPPQRHMAPTFPASSTPAASAHTPVSTQQQSRASFSPAAAFSPEVVTSPPAFTAASQLTDAPATPTLFPTGTPVAPHPTPAAPHPTPVALPGAGMSMQPMMSKHTSPDEVLSSLQKLNLQSRPFDFADEAPGTSSDLLSRPEAADTATPYPEHSTTRAQSSYAMDNSPEYISDATLEQSSAAGHHTAADATDNSPGGEDDVQQMALEDVSVPVNYVSRRTTDPFMEKKLRGLQKDEWSEADSMYKRHKSKLEIAKEHAAAARSSELSTTENVAVRRLVQGAFQRVVATGGQSLGESMVKHKSRLQVEKEQAVQQRKAEEAAQAQRAKRKVVHTPGSWSKQGLGGMGKHKSRLEKEKEAVAAASKSRSGSSSPAVPKRLPSYMRPTSASKAMQVPKGLGEDVTKPKSRLEREKEAAAALRASSDSQPLRRSISHVRSKVAEAWQGQGLDAVMHKRKSKLELDKENAAAAANTTPPAPKQPAAAPRKSFGFGGQGLGEMKVHKSKLQREQDAWAKAAAAEEAHSKPNVRKSMASVIQKPTALSNKKVPSYMKSTHTSQTRMSLDGAADMDARFAH